MGRSEESSDSGSTRRKKSPKKLNRSARLRKYESTYKLCLEKTSSGGEKQRKTSKPIIREEYSKRSIPSSTKKAEAKTVDKDESTPKRPLNAYQKFLQTESKREKYRTKSPKSRMSAIAASWKKKQGKDNGEEKRKK